MQSIHKTLAQGSGEYRHRGRNCLSGKQIIAARAPARIVASNWCLRSTEVSECAIAQALTGFVGGLHRRDIHRSTEDGVYDGHVLVLPRPEKESPFESRSGRITL